MVLVKGRAVALLLVLGCGERRATVGVGDSAVEAAAPADGDSPAADAANGPPDAGPAQRAPDSAVDSAPDRAPEAPLDPLWSDPRQPCALAPTMLAPAPYPADLIQRAATYETLVLGKVTSAPVAATDPARPFRVALLAEKVLHRQWFAGQIPVAGDAVTLAVAEPAGLAVGARAWFFVTLTARPDGGQPAGCAEPRPDWRLDAATYPAVDERVSDAAAFLAAHPVYAASIARAASIVVGTPTSKRPIGAHCSHGGWMATVTIERTLCGGASGEKTVFAIPHGIGGCAGAPEEGPVPPLEVGQRALFLLRAPVTSVWGAHDFSVFDQADVRPPEGWDALVQLRQSADR